MKKPRHNTRPLRFESLEERLVLSVSPVFLGSDGEVSALFASPAEIRIDPNDLPENVSTESCENDLVCIRQSPHVNVKTVQNGEVSSNGQIQKSMIFEFERIIDPGRPDDLDQPLTVEYTISFIQSVETEYYDKIAPLLEKPISLTFQPGETTAQVEFSGFGYNEYKSQSSLGVSLLGITGYDPEVISENPYAWSLVTLVNNPGENSIPRVSVRVVPEQSHGKKVVFEIQRQVDPDDPHAIDVPLEITYNYRYGGYTDWLGDRWKCQNMAYQIPITLVFQPGESKITLEFRGSSDTWIELSVNSPVGSVFIGMDDNGYPLVPPNTSPDYFVEQGRVEYEFWSEASTYEVSGPASGELFEKTVTHWEFSAATPSSIAIMDWEIDWGDGSEPTQILGGPRSRVAVAHYFQAPGTYAITVKTTGFDGITTAVTIGTYTVKEKTCEPEAVLPEFSLQEAPPAAVASFAGRLQPASENHVASAESRLWDIAGIDMYYHVEEDRLPVSAGFFMENGQREKETAVDRLVGDPNFVEETFQPFDEWTMPLVLVPLVFPSILG